jgi:small subunit ribosomal protein S21
VLVFVRDHDVDQAFGVLKKVMLRDGIFREMKLRSHYEKPSERKTRERQRKKHEKTAPRKAEHVVAIDSAPEDKTA